MQDFFLTNPELERKKPIGFLTLKNYRPFSIFGHYINWGSEMSSVLEELSQWVDNEVETISDDLLTKAVRLNYCWYTFTRPILEGAQDMKDFVTFMNNFHYSLGVKLQETFAEKPFLICYRPIDDKFGIVRKLTDCDMYVQVNI